MFCSSNNAKEQSNTNTSNNDTPLTIPRIPPYPGRINTIEIKQLIQTRLGHERSERYFRYLKMYLGSRMEKSMFDRVVVQTISRENIRLHNHLLMSVLRNASFPAVGCAWKHSEIRTRGATRYPKQTPPRLLSSTAVGARRRRYPPVDLRHRGITTLCPASGAE
uniref:Uncharacterized protein n=1 Tax=Oryza meridionalis TaxID=40149 RepID=A0A0E0CEW9_9ORYZ